MANAERFQNGGGQNVVEILALFLAGRIKREDLGEDNQTALDHNFSLMSEDPELAAKVNSRKNQLMLMTGRKIPLFSPDEIKRLTKRRKYKKWNDEPASQPGLWPDEPILNNETFRLENIVDPEKGLHELDRDMSSRFYHHKDSLITEEISEKKSRLRNRIGLPVARGRDSHVNDDFYKFLVRRVFTFDTFEIFREYDRVLDIVPPELDLKINQVKGLVDELLNKGLNRPQRFRRFDQFVQEYRDRRNIPE